MIFTATLMFCQNRRAIILVAALVCIVCHESCVHSFQLPRPRAGQHLRVTHALFTTENANIEVEDGAPNLKKARPKNRSKKERPRVPVLQYHDDWVCVSKPAGMTVHRAGDTPRSQLVLSTLLKRQLSRKVFPVHRLDHRTSGAILFAFDSSTCANLHKSLTSDDAEKSYIALLRGDWKRRFGDEEVLTVDKPLKVKDIVKDAKTEFRMLASSLGDESMMYSPAACSLVLCTPKTGRTHQIRRHAYSIGFPIIGDTRYGDSKINRWWRENRDLNRLFLHCLSLDLPPLATLEKEEENTERIDCTAPLLPELANVLQREDMTDIWNVAKGKNSRLTMEVFDERGGTFGRNYNRNKV